MGNLQYVGSAAPQDVCIRTSPDIEDTGPATAVPYGVGVPRTGDTPGYGGVTPCAAAGRSPGAADRSVPPGQPKRPAT